jgi:hypothetical protein
MKLTVALALLAVAITFGVVLLMLQAHAVSTISHDDGISYLAATGHQALYARDMPSNQWVRASKWQSFWAPGQFWVFSTIARDLATTDIHPPLYFWLLHVWCHVHGVVLSSGPLLNVPFHVVTVLAIFLACRLLSCSPWISATAGVLWLLSGPNLLAASEARQYSLLGAVGACVLVSLIYFLHRPTWSSSSCLCLLSAVGLLTHYHFALLLMILGIVAGRQLRHAKAWRPFVLMSLALCSASLIFFALHPTFYMSFMRQAGQAQAFAWAEVPSRLRTFIRILLEIFLPHRYAFALVDVVFRLWLLLLVAGMAGVIVLLVMLRRQSPKMLTGFLCKADSLPLLGGTITTAAIGALYVSCMSPRHAMGAKYLMLSSPLLFVVLAQSLTVTTRKRLVCGAAASFVLLASQATYGSLSIIRVLERERPPHTNPLLTADSRLVLDSVARGVLPTILWHAHPSTQVLAGSQEALPKRLSGEPLEGVILYVSDLRYGNTTEGRQAVLRAFADRGYRMLRARGNVFGVGTIYELGRSAGEKCGGLQSSPQGGGLD